MAILLTYRNGLHSKRASKQRMARFSVAFVVVFVSSLAVSQCLCCCGFLQYTTYIYTRLHGLDEIGKGFYLVGQAE